ncbi:MAG: nucleotidyltransferase family protein [Chloroflexota bacterium]|nr:nucleotidyltransferase family protein [Chloroflexota bacterium]
MKTLEEIIMVLEEQKPYLIDKYGVIEIGVFGSYVRNEQHPDSDIDLLIELEEPPRISLLDLANLENYLSEILGVKVQTTIKSYIKPRLKPLILREVVVL